MKNKTMRTAAVLGMAVLLTTSVLSGTLAKYTTTNSGSDSATVAKFGVVINVSDDMGLFKTSYAKDDTNAKSANTVVSAASDRKIAPGTKGSMSFSISGTPEVATKLAAEFEPSKTVKLEPGDYILEAGKFAEKECKVTTRSAYEPIKWYFGEKDPASENVSYNLTLAGDSNSLENSLKTLTSEYEPNTNLGKTYYIGWKWDFESASDIIGEWLYDEENTAPYVGATVTNFLDTYLGNEKNLQTEAFDLKISVTQID